jgi:hypothetical protein
MSQTSVVIRVTTGSQEGAELCRIVNIASPDFFHGAREPGDKLCFRVEAR